MVEAFDPYYRWLGIPPSAQPPNHYCLLGLVDFEPDPDVIASAADRQMAHLRTFQTGKHSAYSQQLLNKVAAAKVCLLNPEKKAAYDESLRQKRQTVPGLEPPSPLPPPLPPPIAVDSLGSPLARPPVPPPTVDEAIADVAYTQPVASRRRRRIKTDWVVTGVILLAVAAGTSWFVAGRLAPEPQAPSPKPKVPSRVPQAADKTPPRPDQANAGTKGSVDKSPNLGAASGKKEMPTPPAGAAPTASAKWRAVRQPEEPAPQPPNLPVPSEEVLASVDEKIVDVYDLAKIVTANEKRQLAEKLLIDAQQPGTPPEEKYGMLRQAVQLATSTGDLRKGLAAIDLVAQSFAIDAWKSKEDTLRTFAGDGSSPVVVQTFWETIQSLIDQAVAEEQFDRARRLIEMATDLSAKPGAETLRAEIRQRTAVLTDNIERAEERHQAMQRLKTTPNDAQANLLLGRWHCFVQNDWATGLPYLAKVDDPALQSVVLVELAHPTDPNAQVLLADRWIETGKQQSGMLAEEYQARGTHWYVTAWKSLSGLSQRRVEKTLEEMAPALSPSSKAARAIATAFYPVFYSGDLPPSDLTAARHRLPAVDALVRSVRSLSNRRSNATVRTETDSGKADTSPGPKQPDPTPEPDPDDTIYPLLKQSSDLIRSGADRKAKERLLEAARLDRQDIRATFMLGLAEGLAANNPAAAERYFRRCLESCQQDEACLNNLALVQLRQRNYRQAFYCWNQTLRDHRTPAEVAHNLSMLLRMVKENRVKLDGTLFRQLNDLLELANKHQPARTGPQRSGFVYLKGPTTPDLGPVPTLPDDVYEDCRCLVCSGRGETACPVAGCAQGKVRAYKPGVSANLGNAGGRVTEMVPTRVTCSTCNGKGFVKCVFCDRGIDPKLKNR